MPTARFFVSIFALGATALLWLAANSASLGTPKCVARPGLQTKAQFFRWTELGFSRTIAPPAMA